MRQHGLAPSLTTAFFSFWRNRQLVRQMVRREVVGRYRGSFIGLLWSFLNPVLMLTVYTFVFSIVFQARWGGGSGDKFEFATILFAGLIVFSLFAECVNRAPSLILENVNYVKKVVFPLEILPWVAMGSALFHAAVSLAVLLLFLGALHGQIHWTVIFLPLVWLPLLLLIVGCQWMLASLGVYVRDVVQAVGMMMTVLMFLSPIFYPVSALPEGIRGYLFLNPLTLIIEQTRNVLIWGKMPDWGTLAAYAVVSAAVAWLGLFWFQKTRNGFADVL